MEAKIKAYCDHRTYWINMTKQDPNEARYLRVNSALVYAPAMEEGWSSTYRFYPCKCKYKTPCTCKPGYDFGFTEFVMEAPRRSPRKRRGETRFVVGNPKKLKFDYV